MAQRVVVSAFQTGFYTFNGSGQKTFVPLAGPTSAYEFTDLTNGWRNESATAKYINDLLGEENVVEKVDPQTGDPRYDITYTVDRLHFLRVVPAVGGGTTDEFTGSASIPVLTGSVLNSTAEHYISISLSQLLAHLNAFKWTFNGSNAEDWFRASYGTGATIYGKGGNDHLNGGAHTDLINGGTGRDFIYGLGGNDRVSGGLGNDQLAGGLQRDSFVFDEALNTSTNVDTITDFSHVDDTIRLENAVFTKAGPLGTLKAGALANWDAPNQADDRVLYRHVDSSDAGTAKDTILLYYDPTGGSTSDAVLFARLTKQASVTLNASDFVIF